MIDKSRVRIPESLGDEAYLKILSKLKGKVVDEVKKEIQSKKEEREEIIKISKKEIPNLVKVGTGFVKYAHKLWKLKKGEDGFYLERTSPEKDEFENSVDVSAENIYNRLSKK